MRGSIGIVAVAMAACNGGDDGTDSAGGSSGTGGDTGSPTADSLTTAGTEPGDGSTADAPATDDAPDDTAAPTTDGSTSDTGEPVGVPLWLGVGPWGYRSYSADGVDWQTLQNPSTGDDHSPDLLRDVGWGNGYFVAVGGDLNSMVMRSADGATWEEDLHPAGAGQWMGGVAYGADRWVAVGGNGRVMISDDDGATWSDNEERLPSAGRRVTYADDIFVAVGDNGMIAISSDGEAWVDRTQAGALTGEVAYGYGTWVVIGQNYNGSGFDTSCVTSLDTMTWDPCPFSSGRMDGVVYTDGMLIVAVEDGYEWSNDGQGWTHSDVDVPPQTFRGGDLWVGAESDRRLSGDSLDTLVQTEMGERGFRSFVMGWVPEG